MSVNNLTILYLYTYTRTREAKTLMHFGGEFVTLHGCDEETEI